MGPEDSLNLTRFAAHSQRAKCFPAPQAVTGHSYIERGAADRM